MPASDAIDPVDARILGILQRDGRASFNEIGTAVGMSGPSAHERVKKLEARAVITGYGATVDPASVGLDLLAFIFVTQAAGSIATDLTTDFAAISEIEECHHIAGEADYLLKVRAARTQDLERVLHAVQAIQHVSATETQVVLSTAFERRPLPMHETDGRSRT